MNDLSLDEYLKFFLKTEKDFLLANYPGLTMHRLKQELKLFAVLKGIDSDDFFDFSHTSYASAPITHFFKKLKNGIPLEYITGFAYFYKSLFKVTTDVLIPRNETEILVELASLEIQKNYKNKKCRVLDVGTGAGTIALSLLLEDVADLEMTASDISEKALAVAEENFFNQQYLFTKGRIVNFIKSDRLQSVSGEFDLILSNPPYIKEREDLNQVHHQVREHEPHLALFLKDEVYDAWFYDFFTQIYQSLSDHGVSLIEGHENHLEHLAKSAMAIGFKKVQVIKDYTDRDRFLKLQKC